MQNLGKTWRNMWENTETNSETEDFASVFSCCHVYNGVTKVQSSRSVTLQRAGSYKKD